MQDRVGSHEAALKSLNQLVVIRRTLAFENPAVTSLKSDLSRAHLELGRQHQRMGNLQAANLSFRRARELIELLPRETADEMLELAAVYGDLAAPVEGVVTLPDDDDQREQKQFASDALTWLQKAIDAGYRNADALRKNPSFLSLRERDEFQQLLTRLEQLGDAEQVAKLADDDQSATERLATRTQAVAVLRDLIDNDSDQKVRQQRTLAALLHSQGVIQMDLKQYDAAGKSLDEALEIRLRHQDEDDVQSVVDLVTTQYRKGLLLCGTNRVPEAHRLWQDTWKRLDELSAEHQSNEAVESALSEIRGSLARFYGELGLWNQAARSPLAQLARGSLDDSNWSVWMAAVLLPIKREQEYREIIQLADERLRERRRNGQELGAWEPGTVALQASLLSDSGLPSDYLVSLARESVAADPNAQFMKVGVVISLLRNGQHKEALDLAQENSWGRGNAPLERKYDWLVCAYVRVLALSASEQTGNAKRLLRSVEEVYRQHCRELIADIEKRHTDNNLAGINAQWLARIQQLRREAVAALNAQGSSHDNWQELVSARSYQLIGEEELADSALDRVVENDPDDVETWVQLARLKNSEAAWQAALEKFGPEPLLLIERGHWYAEAGLQDKADTDFKLAASAADDGRPAFAAAPCTPDEARAHQEQWADYLGVPVEFENSIGMKFRLIPPGDFQMGTRPAAREELKTFVQNHANGPDSIKAIWARDIDEEPFVRVFLTRPYYAGTFEVTVAEFRRFVEETGYQTDGERTGIGGFASREGWTRHSSHVWQTPGGDQWTARDQQPVVQITWNDAVAFCAWLSRKEGRLYSLPTEAQWEAACRAGSLSVYGTGDDPSVLDETAWNRETLDSKGLDLAQDVGGKAANAFGLHDTLGNANEWCLDAWNAGVIQETPLVNPYINKLGKYRVVRGGSWVRKHSHTHCSGRHPIHVDVYDCLDGFRVVLNIDPETVASSLQKENAALRDTESKQAIE